MLHLFLHSFCHGMICLLVAFGFKLVYLFDELFVDETVSIHNFCILGICERHVLHSCLYLSQLMSFVILGL